MILPKVTIIMATYNRCHFILETLSSIENQTYLNWECLIIDDMKIGRRQYAELMAIAENSRLIHLYPRYNGDYIEHINSLGKA